MSRFGLRYGAGPLHLLSVIASFAIAVYALLEILAGGSPLNFAIWFIVAVLAHDLLAFPLYSALGLLAGRALGAREGSETPAALNYIRIPALISAITLLVWFPLVLQVDADSFAANTGLSTESYLAKWLLLTAALFVASGVAYALKLRSRPKS